MIEDSPQQAAGNALAIAVQQIRIRGPAYGQDGIRNVAVTDAVSSAKAGIDNQGHLPF